MPAKIVLARGTVTFQAVATPLRPSVVVDCPVPVLATLTLMAGLIRVIGFAVACLDTCDPLAQDCDDGLRCDWGSDTFRL